MVESPLVPLLPQKLLSLISGDVPPNEHPRKLYTKHRRCGSICVVPNSRRERERERERIFRDYGLPSTERKSVVLSAKGSFSLPSLNRVGKWLFSLAAYARTLRPRRRKRRSGGKGRSDEGGNKKKEKKKRKKKEKKKKRRKKRKRKKGRRGKKVRAKRDAEPKKETEREERKERRRLVAKHRERIRGS